MPDTNGWTTEVDDTMAWTSPTEPSSGAGGAFRVLQPVGDDDIGVDFQYLIVDSPTDRYIWYVTDERGVPILDEPLGGPRPGEA